jgi:hypothetical protein
VASLNNLKHKVAEQLAGVENGLEELFKKYGVSSYSGLMEKFSKIPEKKAWMITLPPRTLNT